MFGQKLRRKTLILHLLTICKQPTNQVFVIVDAGGASMRAWDMVKHFWYSRVHASYPKGVSNLPPPPVKV